MRKLKDNSIMLSPWPVKMVLRHEVLDESLEGTTSEISPGVVQVQINSIYANDEALLSIVHECMHVVQYVEEVIENSLDKESEAYLLQSLVEWCMEKIGLKVQDS